MKKKIILVGNFRLFQKQMKILKYKKNLNKIFDISHYSKRAINIIDVKYKFKKAFSKISNSSNKYIEECFRLSLNLIKQGKADELINGPISKKYFLKKKFPGITEYIAKKTNSKNPVMLIYNKNLSVSPVTTHTPIKHVAKFIKKEKIINNVTKIDSFYRSKLKKKPKIAILGLNPHCETTDRVSEEQQEINPAIKYLQKIKVKVTGPIAADTFFLYKNIKKFDVVIGMYHDQVLPSIKTIYNFEAINITLGLPFLKITPDHGPNQEMVGKNKSDPSSIFYALNFLNKYK